MKILLAIDESSCSQAAVQAVCARFRPENAEVRVLHVDEWPKGLPPSLTFAEGPTAAEAILAARDATRRRADALVAGAAARLTAAGFPATTEIRQGDARHEILECAADWHPDVLVVGSHGKGGLDRFLLGSVSESVARHAGCSVEIVRGLPEGTVPRRDV